MNELEGQDTAPPVDQASAAPSDPVQPADAVPAGPDPDAPLFEPPEMEAITLGDGPQDVKTLDRDD